MSVVEHPGRKHRVGALVAVGVVDVLGRLGQLGFGEFHDRRQRDRILEAKAVDHVGIVLTGQRSSHGQFELVAAHAGDHGHVGHGGVGHGLEEQQVGAAAWDHLPAEGVADGDVLDPLEGSNSIMV